MDVKEIVKKYLKDNGYDGLVRLDVECGCKLDDLMPCNGPEVDCEPGYLQSCPEGSAFDFIIGLEKKQNISNPIIENEGEIIMVQQHQTTRWENVKNRVQWLKEHGTLYGEGAELAMALCEEMDELQKRIEKLENELSKIAMRVEAVGAL